MKTLKNKLDKAGIITKAGKINDHYASAVVNSRTDAKEKRIYTFQWRNKGRSARDTSERVFAIVRALGYKYSFGNDAPKGGREGDFIQLYSRQAYRVITRKILELS